MNLRKCKEYIAEIEPRVIRASVDIALRVYSLPADIPRNGSGRVRRVTGSGFIISPLKVVLFDVIAGRKRVHGNENGNIGIIVEYSKGSLHIIVWPLRLSLLHFRRYTISYIVIPFLC